MPKGWSEYVRNIDPTGPDRIVRFFTDMKTVLETIQDHDRVFTEFPVYLFGNGVAEGEPPSLKMEFFAQIDALLTEYHNDLGQQIEDAEISEERKLELARYGSKIAFSESNDHFPIPVFQTINLLDDAPQGTHQYTFNLNQYQKGQLTNPLYATPVSNEVSWLSNTMEEVVANAILGKVLQQAGFVKSKITDPIDFWETVRDCALRLEKPTVLISRSSSPKWLLGWIRGHLHTAGQYARPRSFETVRRSSDGGNNFLGEARIGNEGKSLSFRYANLYPGECILLDEGSLTELTFYKAEGGDVPLQVDFDSDAENKQIGTLTFEWKYDLEIQQSEGLRIDTLDAEEN